MTRLLFDSQLILGLDYAANIISEAESDLLISSIEQLELAPFRFHGWVGKRRTRSFGWRYNFDDASFAPTEPLPQWLHPLRQRAADFAGLDPDLFVHVLVARYDPGAGIGWHRDRDVFDQVVGVSLNTAATLRFRQRSSDGFRRTATPLEPRSAYRLSGPSRWDWEHSIVAGDQLRFSITFRTLSTKGLAISARSD